MIDILVEIAKDRRLRGVPMAVFVLCLKELDPKEYRSLKHLHVARVLRMDLKDVRRALGRLVRSGLLVRKPGPQGLLRFYRLNISTGGGILPPDRIP